MIMSKDAIQFKISRVATISVNVNFMNVIDLEIDRVVDSQIWKSDHFMDWMPLVHSSNTFQNIDYSI